MKIYINNKLYYVLIGIFTGLIIILFCIFIINSFISQKYQNKVFPNVYLNNKPVEGLTQKDLREKTLNEINNLNKISIVFSYDSKLSAAVFGKNLNFSIDEKKLTETLFSIGRENKFIDRFISRFSLFMLKKPRKVIFLPSFKLDPIVHILEDIRLRYEKQPKNALFEFDGFKVTAFAKEEIGTRILTNKALSQAYSMIEKAILNQDYRSIKINVYDEPVNPSITLSETNQFGIKDLIGSGSSDFAGSIENRIYNIQHAASKFHGLIIKEEEEVSFNKIVGNISALTGFKQAYIIKNGRTVLGDGGGICQVSTTLFRAALNSGLKITERHPHAYRVHYYEENSSPGLDATVFAPSVDFKFVNNTETPILIQTEINKEKHRLTVYFYGKKDNREILISPVIIWDVVPPPEPLYQDDPTLPSGSIKQVDWASWGAKTKFSYTVQKNGKFLQNKEFYSFYSPWQAVYLRGT